MIIKKLNTKIDVSCAKSHFGNLDYGGWTIHPDIINDKSIVYSFGVGNDISFDLDIINTFKCKVHAFDPTPKSIDWIYKQNTPNEFVFHSYGIFKEDGEILLFPPDNDSYFSYTIVKKKNNKNVFKASVYRLSSIMSMLEHEQVDLLKMDIEGAEYDVIDDIIASGLNITQILVEFHHRMPEFGFEKTNRTIKNLFKAGYKVFNVSTSQEEYSFIRK